MTKLWAHQKLAYDFAYQKEASLCCMGIDVDRAVGFWYNYARSPCESQ